MSTPGNAPHGEPARPDVCAGEPAGGLIWDLEGLSPHHLPSEESFYTENRRKYLRSASFEHMIGRQRDRPPTWYTTVYEDVEYAETEEGPCDVFSWRTPLGDAVGRRHRNHFGEYPVKGVGDLDIWTFVHRHMRFRPNDPWLQQTDAGHLARFGVNWSPVQQLLQFDMGLEGFYYLLADAPRRMDELLTVMHECCKERLRLGLSLFPSATSVYWGENTSSSSISPPHYRRLTLPHIRDYARLAHEQDKRLIVHMCGLLKDLLECFALTGMDGIHSVTPPPFGDAPYALVRSTFGPAFTIIGRLNAALWVGRSKEEIQAVVRQQITPDLFDTPFSLMVTTDAIPDIPYDSVMVLFDALETIQW